MRDRTWVVGGRRSEAKEEPTCAGLKRSNDTAQSVTCLHWRGIRPMGCCVALMSPGVDLRSPPPSLLRSAQHPISLIWHGTCSGIDGHQCGNGPGWWVAVAAK